MQFFKSGAFATDTLTDIIMLYGKTSASGNVTHLRAPWSTSGYRTTAGKTLYVVRVKLVPAGNGQYFKFGYADNDVGLDTTTARSNPVMALGLDDTGANGWSQPTSEWNNGQGIAFPWMLATSLKYPFVRAIHSSGVDSHVFLWCVER